MTRVRIADDQGIVRDGLRMILEAQEDIEVVGEAADGLDALQLAGELEPDASSSWTSGCRWLSRFNAISPSLISDTCPPVVGRSEEDRERTKKEVPCQRS